MITFINTRRGSVIYVSTDMLDIDENVQPYVVLGPKCVCLKGNLL